MKKLYPLLSVLFLISTGFSQREYNQNDLVKMDNGLWTVKFSDEPISGKVYGYFGEESNPKKRIASNNLKVPSASIFAVYSGLSKLTATWL